MYNKNDVSGDLNESNVVLFTISPPQQIAKKKKKEIVVSIVLLFKISLNKISVSHNKFYNY
jgi:hypothetical protein